MTNSINDIKNFFDRHRGIQRPNRFSLEFSLLPRGLPPYNQGDLQLISVSMATRAIDVMFDNLAGYNLGRAVPRSTKFVGGVLLTFPVTGDNFILKFINSWFNLIFPESAGGRQVNYYDEVVKNSTMRIRILDLNGNISSTYEFYEVYPLETLPIELNMDDKNTFLTHTVLFNYRNYIIS